jgi:hypothetical protein
MKKILFVRPEFIKDYLVNKKTLEVVLCHLVKRIKPNSILILQSPKFYGIRRTHILSFLEMLMIEL